MRLGSLLVPDIKQILKEDPEQVRALLDEIHAEDLAEVIAELEPDEAAALLLRMPAEDAAPIFERLEEHEQAELAEEMSPESVAHIASEMAPDDRADFFSLLPQKAGEEILENLEKVDPVAAEEVRALEKWPEDSAGHMMTTDYVRVRPEMTIAEAMRAVRVRAKEKSEFVYSTYAVNAAGNLEGIASVRDLIIADEPEEERTNEPYRERARIVSDILRTNVISVLPTTHQEDTARTMAKYDLNAMPVVDEKGKLLGVITIDDVVDVLVAEQTEDVQKIGGVEPLDVPYFQTSFLSFIRKRAVWLVVLFLEEFFTQTALRYYDPVFKAIEGASYYVPLLISTGGNSGAQSSTLVIRGMAIGEIKLKDWWRILFREAGMGVVLGLILGTIGFGRVLMYHKEGTPLINDVPFAATVALTLVGIVMTGCTVGSMLPILLKRLGIDPATSSTPFIASLVDVLGIIVFVHIAKLIMRAVIDAYVPGACDSAESFFFSASPPSFVRA